LEPGKRADISGLLGLSLPRLMPMVGMRRRLRRGAWPFSTIRNSVRQWTGMGSTAPELHCPAWPQRRQRAPCPLRTWVNARAVALLWRQVSSANPLRLVDLSRIGSGPSWESAAASEEGAWPFFTIRNLEGLTAGASAWPQRRQRAPMSAPDIGGRQWKPLCRAARRAGIDAPAPCLTLCHGRSGAIEERGEGMGDAGSGGRLGRT
jgi:hypothetical protein